MSTDRRRAARLAGCAVAVTAAAVLSACGSGDASTPPGAATPAAATPTTAAVATAPVLASVGDLRVAAGYVPSPASPDVAAAYFTVVNDGTAPDTLVSATSDASTTTTMHRTEGGSMVPITRFEIPADGTAAFTPGADHLMLEGLTRTLDRGGRVTLTLDFATAGTVTVTVPVTGYPTGGGLPSEALSPLPSTTVAP